MSQSLYLAEGKNRLFNIWQLDMAPYLKDSNAYAICMNNRDYVVKNGLVNAFLLE